MSIFLAAFYRQVSSSFVFRSHFPENYWYICLFCCLNLQKTNIFKQLWSVKANRSRNTLKYLSDGYTHFTCLFNFNFLTLFHVCGGVFTITYFEWPPYPTQKNCWTWILSPLDPRPNFVPNIIPKISRFKVNRVF